MKYLITLALVVSFSGICDAKCRRLGRLFGKRIVKPACTVVSVPACGTFVAEAAPVEVIIVEQTQQQDTPPVPAHSVEAPAAEKQTNFNVPAPPAPAISMEEIIGNATKPSKDNSPIINFKLK